jgi:hypothetical protein
MRKDAFEFMGRPRAALLELFRCAGRALGLFYCMPDAEGMPLRPENALARPRCRGG